MARDHRCLANGQLAFHHVEIRAAHPAGADSYQHLARTRFGAANLGKIEWVGLHRSGVVE
jgi:hypothetical protein